MLTAALALPRWFCKTVVVISWCGIREAYRETLRHCPFETVAVIILPDHFHLVLRLPENCNDFSRIVQVLKTNFSKRLPDSCRRPNASQSRIK